MGLSAIWKKNCTRELASNCTRRSRVQFRPVVSAIFSLKPMRLLINYTFIRIQNSRMIRLDMALKRKLGLENLQKVDYDQILL